MYRQIQLTKTEYAEVPVGLYCSKCHYFEDGPEDD
jgi:hypothetical protein